MRKNYTFLRRKLQTIFFAIALLVFTGNVNGQFIYGLSNGNLVCFKAKAPSVILSSVPVTGIAVGQSITGLDFRPATGELFALGYNSSNGESQLYNVDRSTGVAAMVNVTPVILALGSGQISFDFNPTVDRIRVVGSNNTNYRLNPVTGAIAATDLNLSYAVGDANAGTDPAVGAVAYTNSYIGATSTTLYDVDDSLNTLATQNPPNNGTLNTVGSLGISVNLSDWTTDLDIYFNPQTFTNVAYFVANPPASANDMLYTVNLTTGAATLVGNVGIPLQDIACYIPHPEQNSLKGQLVYGLTSNNNLISFDSNLPNLIRSSVAVTGVTAGQTLVGMDFRPATGELYTMGYNSTTGEAQLYTLNRTTAVVTAINATPVVLALGTGPVGFDFNPTVDRIRVVSANNANYRLHPVTGAIAATDVALNYAAGDVNAGADPSVGTVAYTNSYIGATSTTLYDYDDVLNVIATQNPPNNGTLNTTGSSGITVNASDASSDMDIVVNTSTFANMAFLSANTGSSLNDNLYTINLSTGAVSNIGSIGYGIAVRDIACYIKGPDLNSVKGQLVYGLTSNNNLISFDSNLPNLIRSSVAVTGVTAGQTLVGMDFRPATGELYTMGYNSTTGEAQLYTLNRTTAVVTAINATPVVLALGTGPVGFDFNPTVDRIRVVSANNANYRLHPVTGAIAATDVALNYAAGDVNAGADPSVGTVAYTNSYIGATSTTLYDYDDVLNVIATQNPPNNGTLNTTGSSGITVNASDASSDMDIVVNTSTFANMAFLSANTGSSLNDNLYTINLSTGAVSNIGSIGYGIAVRDIACYIKGPDLNSVKGQLVYGLTSNNNLISFDSNLPNLIRSSVAVTGVTAGQTLVGMDFRPANKQLYALGYNSTTSEAQLYTIVRTTGVATAVNATPQILILGTGNIGMDFNPTVDRIRVVGANDANYRLNPLTGAIAATDINLNYAAGDANAGVNPSISSVAYANSFNGATSTTLFDYDDVLNILATQNPPNNGTLNTVGASGIILNSSDATADIDIFYDYVSMTNKAYLCANESASLFDKLYVVNTLTGSAVLSGNIGYGIAVKDIAVYITASSANSLADNSDNAFEQRTSENYLTRFSVYPNPSTTSGKVYVGFELEESAKVDVVITDVAGRIIAKPLIQSSLEKGAYEVDWTTSSVKPGIYVVQLYINKTLKETTKVIIR